MKKLHMSRRSPDSSRRISEKAEGRRRIHHPLFAISMLALASCFTGCETIETALYEPVPYDEVAAEHGITLEEAAALGIVRPKTSLEPLIQATTSFIPAPGSAPLASLALNGALAIGAVWLGKRKRTADKVATSLVQGIDTFRDILDQTPQGAKIDAKLKETLRQHQQALQVQKEISKLLDRYATPHERAHPTRHVASGFTPRSFKSSH